MFGKLIKAIALSCSVLVASFGWSNTFAQLDAELRKASDSEAARILKSEVDPEDDIYARVSRLPEDGKGVGPLRTIVSQRAAAESSATVSPEPTTRAKEIKGRNILYRDAGEKETGNWLSKALEKLGEAIMRLFSRRGSGAGPGPQVPSLLGPWLVYTLWGLLFILLATFLVFAVRHISWKRRLSRKASALLDDDEPERTLDEWLGMADRLEAEGKFREAVRCLYLACLLKFDEYHVARFDRGQTNWEHLARIQASPNRPPDLDFRPPTRAFDAVWYGMRCDGKPDVDRFRAWYSDILSALGRSST